MKDYKKYGKLGVSENSLTCRQREHQNITSSLKDFLLNESKEELEKILTIDDESVCKVWFNDSEWIVFQPFTFEVAKLAYRKDRENNWRSTYDKESFYSYGGGNIIYCINKLNYTKDVAFELYTKDIVKKLNHEDDYTKISVFEMKNEFDKNSKIYELFDEIEHEIKIPKLSRIELEKKANEYFNDFSLEDLDDADTDVDLILSYLDKIKFPKKYINDEIDFYLNQPLIVVLKEISNWQSIYDYITANYLEDVLLEFFKCRNVSELQEKMLNGEFDYEDIVDLVVQYNDECEITKYLINQKCKNYSSRDVFYDFYGRHREINISDLIKIAGWLFDEWSFKKYVIQKKIDNMSDEEIIETIFHF